MNGLNGETNTISNYNRNSSFELLRIICMVLIIAHHYSVHGGYGNTTLDNLNGARIYLQVLSMFGKVSCSIFVMISGFCLISPTPRQNHYRKIVVFGAEIIFYSIIIYLFAYFSKIYAVSIKDGLKAIFAFVKGNWFAVGYLCMYAFVPLINPMLLSISKKQFQLLLIIMVITWSIIPTFHGAQTYGDLGFFIVTYTFGAYTKLYFNNDFKYSNSKNLVIGLSFAIIMCLSVLLFDTIGYIFHINYFIEYATCLNAYNSIIAVPCAFFIFVYFSNINFYNKTVNIIASTMLGVYLIHDNYIMRPILWMILSPNVDYINSPYLHSVIKIICVFVGCVLIDLIREYTVGKWFCKWFYGRADSMWSKALMVINIGQNKK